MAGASIPLTPAVHQMIDIGPVPQFEHTTKEVGFPIVRDMDTNMYERQHGSGFEIGSYAHRAILMDADDIPSIEASALSPTMLPFTQEDFDPQLEDALELFPEIVGDESVGREAGDQRAAVAHARRQPDHRRDARGQGALVGGRDLDQGGAGDRQGVAEWMTTGEPEIDPHGSDIARFYDHHKTAQHIAARASEGFNKTYGIVHPMEQWASNRPIRLSPAYDRHVELGAEFFEAAGWERPLLVRHERVAARRVRRPGDAARGRMGVALVVADHQRRAPRDARSGRAGRPVGVRDLRRHRARARWPPSSGCASTRSTSRPAGPSTRRSSTRPAGSSPTSRSCGSAHDRFRVVTGGGMGMRDRKIFQDAMPADGSAQLHDVTNAFTTFGLWGPRARDILGAAADGSADISHKGFPFLTSKTVDIDGVRTLASRISYVGELGWEIYVPIEQGLRVWDALWRAGQPHGLAPVGIGTYAVTSRLEKGYRAHGAELELDFDLVEAGMARPTRQGRRLRRPRGLPAASATRRRPRSCAR